MPQFYEVYGTDLGNDSQEADSIRRCGLCPFTQSQCDGGGNRHQTGIKLDSSPLKDYFSEDIKKVVPGVCSIEYGSASWIVCPRRLLGFKNSDKALIPQVNFSLNQHELEALRAAGLPQGIRLGVWSEVYLQFKEDGTDINYHFDFLIAPIQQDASMQWLVDYEGVTDRDTVKELWDNARKGGYLKNARHMTTAVPVLPRLDQPTVLEVMTASTSGSNTEKRTNIASAFEDALLGKQYNCPGINKRQVWGRMATQLFAKSALAESWGGKTVWMVQDELLKNIELTTKLSLNQESSAPSSTINFLCLKYAQEPNRGGRKLELDFYIERDAGIDFSADNRAADILLPKTCPDKVELLKSVLRRELSAIIEL